VQVFSEMDEIPKMPVRIPELDGIRGTAIGMVLVWHFVVLGPALQPAPASFLSRCLIVFRLNWTGVDLFFVLSGFLIGGILLDAQKSSNYFQTFYTRRFFRIVPLYAAVMLVAFPLLLIAVRSAHNGHAAWLGEDIFPWYSFWTFTQNLWMARQNTVGAHIPAVTWSLAVEEQFYLTLPLIIRFFRGRWLMVLVVSGICAAPILRMVILAIAPDHWVAAFVLMPCRADALLFGVLATILLRKESNWELFRRSTRYFVILFFLQLAGLACLLLKAPSCYDALMQKVGYTWVSFFYVTLLVFVLTHAESFVGAFFRIKALRWLGIRAYGNYLIHHVILGFVFALIWGQLPQINGFYMALGSLVCLAMTLLIANLSWRFFETPIIRLGHGMNYQIQERQVPAIPLVASSEL
jgi:peptidoglycan/LPS O-acetylase OafA/YrhL